MRSIILLTLALAFTACSPVSQKSQEAEPVSPPNVIIILADDMGFGDVGANGAKSIATPALDALAKRGANFTQFYASANVCSPSRAGLMTGRYPIRSGLAYGVIEAKDTRGIPASEQTLGELAQSAGYATKFIGKWHLGLFPDYAPMKHGFDQFLGVPHSNDMPDFALYEEDEVVEREVDQSKLTERYTQAATEFIDANSGGPFLLFVSHTMPHIPLYPSAGFVGKSNAGTYGDVVEEIDASTGRIVETLKRNGLFENTIIIFTSDNGPFFEGGTSGLKGGKGSTWEGAYRVPLLISWPAGFAPAGDVDAISMNTDILPTVAAAIGTEPSAKILDGANLLPILRKEAESAHDYLLYFNNEEVVGIRDQQWKYLTHTYYRRSIGAFEKFDQLDGFSRSYDLLFQAKAAGGEAYSMADRQPEVLSRMKAQLAKARAEMEPLRTHSADETFPR